MSWEIREGDSLDLLRAMPAESVQCCVTSPPYYGLRDYDLPPSEWGDGWVGCLGLEPSPDQFIAHLVEVFAEVRRVLRDDGTLWVNMGDSYADRANSRSADGGMSWRNDRARVCPPKRGLSGDLKQKDLIGIPWMLAFALRADGWYLRSDIIWSKPNPMPESVKDRPTNAHEHIFLLAKSPVYFYDGDGIREADCGSDHTRTVLDGQPSLEPSNGLLPRHRGLRTAAGRIGLGRNKRSVWTVSPQPFPDAHFATFPPKLIEPCVLAGAAKGDTILDPFAGAGTTGLVALRHGRSFVGLELSPVFAEMARRRLRDDSPLFNVASELVA